MSLKLTILGSHSATPREHAHPTAQILEIKNHTFLIDCGEGTQIQLRKNKISFAKINHIFISHLHGDHFFGLIGLISSFSLLGRKKELNIYAPKDLQEIIELQLRLTQSRKEFEIIFHPLTSDQSELILDNQYLSVRTIPLKHRIYTNGFIFYEKKGLLNLNKEVIEKYSEIKTCDYYSIKLGENFVSENGKIIANEELTLPHKKLLSYAFCSDTSFQPQIIQNIYEVDLLYHESTFLSKHEKLAILTGHSTAKQAATIAKKAKVKQLILGHFSNRYKNQQDFLDEASEVFENTLIAEEGQSYTVA